MLGILSNHVKKSEVNCWEIVDKLILFFLGLINSRLKGYIELFFWR